MPDFDEAESESYELTVHGITEGAHDPEGFDALTVETNRGGIALRLYDAPNANIGLVWFGGAGGGWDTPASGMYPRLCREFSARGITSCRVKFRNPGSLEESVLDALVAARFLIESGCERLGVIGHSLGGAVAIQVALNESAVRTVVALSTQTYGATGADDLGREQSVLFVHGQEDDILPPTCSVAIHRLVPGRKRLVLVEGARHVLDEAADDVSDTVKHWLWSELGGDGMA